MSSVRETLSSAVSYNETVVSRSQSISDKGEFPNVMELLMIEKGPKANSITSVYLSSFPGKALTAVGCPKFFTSECHEDYSEFIDCPVYDGRYLDCNISYCDKVISKASLNMPLLYTPPNLANEGFRKTRHVYGISVLHEPRRILLWCYVVFNVDTQEVRLYPTTVKVKGAKVFSMENGMTLDWSRRSMVLREKRKASSSDITRNFVVQADSFRVDAFKAKKSVKKGATADTTVSYDPELIEEDDVEYNPAPFEHESENVDDNDSTFTFSSSASKRAFSETQEQAKKLKEDSEKKARLLEQQAAELEEARKRLKELAIMTNQLGPPGRFGFKNDTINPLW